MRSVSISMLSFFVIMGAGILFWACYVMTTSSLILRKSSSWAYSGVKKSLTIAPIHLGNLSEDEDCL